MKKDEPQLSKEEARLKALELQKQIRAKVKEKERQAQIEREKKRIKMGKEISEARRIMEENQQKLHFENLKKQKTKDEIEREKVRAQIEADKKARFGDDYNDEKNKPIIIKEDFYKVFLQMKKIYRYTDKNGLMNCLKTIGKYLGNIVKNPNEAKFKTINPGNKVFVKRIGNMIGGMQLLKVAGFMEDGSMLLFTGTQEGLQEYLGYLHDEVSKMENFQG